MSEKRLNRLKLIHTLIWAAFVLIFIYIFIDLLFNWISFFLWISVGAVFAETIILLIFGWRCPLTLQARKYTESHESGFDIYLPGWFAKHNKTIFSIVFIIEMGMLVWRLLTNPT